MKKIINNVNSCLVLALLAVIVITQFGCKKTQEYGTATPVIIGVRNYVAAPGDSLLTKVGPGQWVVVRGQNLKGALQVYFDGVKASFNDAWFSDTTAIVLIPSVIAFPTVPSNQLNTIRYVTNHGETSFSFPIIAPAPTINSVSNEEASPGDSVTISGFNFFFINSVVYAGKTVTGFTGSNDGTTIRMAVPAGVSTGGFVTVTTKSGVATSIFAVHDLVTGMACNFDNIFTYQYYSGNLTSSATLFPGNLGSYVQLSVASMGANDYAWYNGGRSINLNAVQWVPVANLADPIANWALKFEVYVKAPWKSGSLLIRRDESGGWGFVARYEPWKTATGGIYQTSGWTTVVIPLTQFRLPSTTGVNGAGNQSPDIPTLMNTQGPTWSTTTNNNGKRGMSFMLINDVSTPSAAIDMAIDNIRFVKIK